MRLLTVSDEVVPLLHQPRVKEAVGPVDLILSCGDLQPTYIEYLVTLLNAPCYYVRGNHDTWGELREDGTWQRGPQGCEDLDLRVVNFEGLLLAGVEGSIRYKKGDAQYSDQEMTIRLWRLVPRLLLNKLRYGRYLDIMISHAPPRGIHDGPSAHRGFIALRRFIERFEPRYLIHGHVHPRYGYSNQSPFQYHKTLVINTCGYQILEVELAKRAAR